MQIKLNIVICRKIRDDKEMNADTVYILTGYGKPGCSFVILQEMALIGFTSTLFGVPASRPPAKTGSICIFPVSRSVFSLCTFF